MTSMQASCSLNLTFCFFLIRMFFCLFVFFFFFSYLYKTGMEVMFITKKQTERQCHEELVKCRDV